MIIPLSKTCEGFNGCGQLYLFPIALVWNTAKQDPTSLLISRACWRWCQSHILVTHLLQSTTTTPVTPPTTSTNRPTTTHVRSATTSPLCNITWSRPADTIPAIQERQQPPKKWPRPPNNGNTDARSTQQPQTVTSADENHIRPPRNATGRMHTTNTTPPASTAQDHLTASALHLTQLPYFWPLPPPSLLVPPLPYLSPLSPSLTSPHHSPPSLASHHSPPPSLTSHHFPLLFNVVK